MNKNRIVKIIKFIFIIIALIAFIYFYDNITGHGFNDNIKEVEKLNVERQNLKVLSSSENKDFERELVAFAKSKNINLEFEYAGNLEIIDILNSRSIEYDVVWNSNSIWNYMLNNSYLLSDSVSVSTNPVVFGIKKSKAEELGVIGREIRLSEIVDLILDGGLKFGMANPSRTNAGASTYLGLLSAFSNNPEVLKSEHIQNQDVKNILNEFYKNLDRSFGSEDFLEQAVLNNELNVIATYEFEFINMNKKLIREGREPFYLLYPEDGVSISDSPFSYIDNGDDAKKEAYNIIKEFIVSKEGQAKLASLGRRTWYGGTTQNANLEVFNPDWGIDTSKYIVPVKYPHVNIIKEALGLYQTELRRPMITVFCLDYSGSMQGAGKAELVSAMEYILNQESASKDYIQFVEKDHIVVIPFSGEVRDVWGIYTGNNTTELLEKIRNFEPTGSTNIYDTLMVAIEVLKEYDSNQYSRAIVLMTDGKSNRGNYVTLHDYYFSSSVKVPVYSIEFGEADNTELTKINILTNGKSFDGKKDLLKAFKEVRGYN